MAHFEIFLFGEAKDVVKVPESRSQAAVTDVRNCCVSIPTVPDRKKARGSGSSEFELQGLGCAVGLHGSLCPDLKPLSRFMTVPEPGALDRLGIQPL